MPKPITQRRPVPRSAPATEVNAERAAPLAAEELQFFVAGEKRFGLANRFVFADDELLHRGAPGSAVAWRVDRVGTGAGTSNPFWDSLNNRSDPALLRAQARFLELSASTRKRVTVEARADLVEQVKTLLTKTGLDGAELDYFQRPARLAVIKRLAASAGIPLSQVLVVARSTQYDPDLRRVLPGDVITLAKYESLVEDPSGWLPTFREMVPLRTSQAQREKDAFDQSVATMSEYFRGNPNASLADFSAHQEKLARSGDQAFWHAMEDMMERADLADLAGRPAGGRGRNSEWFSTHPIAPPHPNAGGSRTGGTRGGSMTSWEIVSHPRFSDFLGARVGGFRGSFFDYLGR